MQTNIGLLVARLILLGAILGGAGLVVAQNPTQFKNLITQKIPTELRNVEQKIKTIKTPTPMIGSLSPARDLTGTWSSAIRGKGFQLYGQFATGPGETKVYEDGDIELVITGMQGNTAVGTIRYSNMSVTGSTYVPGYGNITVPTQHTADTGAQPIRIGVSSSHLDFGSFNGNGISYTMQGNYTTNIMSGTMTANVPPYGVIKGEFHLTRPL